MSLYSDTFDQSVIDIITSLDVVLWWIMYGTGHSVENCGVKYSRFIFYSAILKRAYNFKVEVLIYLFSEGIFSTLGRYFINISSQY